MIKDIKKTIGLVNTPLATAKIKLNGELHALILNCSSPCRVCIYTEESEIILFEKLNCHNEGYIALGVEQRAPNGDKLTFGTESFYLNDNLIIEVEGSLGTECNLCLRYSDA